MIDALVSGKLVRDPMTKTGPSGKPYCNFLLSVPVGEESPVLVSGMAFNEAAQRIGKLGKGDALSVTGALKPNQWTDKQTGETKHGLNVTVSACLSAYDIQKKRKPAETKPKGNPEPLPPEYPPSHGFDDPMGF